MKRGVVVAIVALLAAATSCSSAGRPDDGEHVEQVSEPKDEPMPESSERAQQTPIRLEDVAHVPAPGGGLPGSIAFAPQSGALTYLYSPERTLVRDLFVHDLATGGRSIAFTPEGGGATEANLSPEEKLRRERARERGLGVTAYEWAKDADRMLVPVRGDLWVKDGVQAEARKLVEGGDAPILDPRWSRDGSAVAYVHREELYVVDVASGEPRQLTTGARGTGKTHGLAEYIAQEEMDRHHGYWWSHDGKRIAFTEVDETHIPAFRIAHAARDLPSFEDHGYPFAGEKNAKVKLGVVSVNGGPVRFMDIAGIVTSQDGYGSDPDDFYLARVDWSPQGELLAQLENRAQSRLDLVRFDPQTGQGRVLLTERSDVWINLHHDLRPIGAEGGEFAGNFVWASERTGFKHLYLYDHEGNLVRPLTEGEWMVDHVEGVDAPRGLVYFTATKEGPTERHLYRVSLRGGEIERLTTEPGMHYVMFDRLYDRFVDLASTLDHPPTITVRAANDGKTIATIDVPTDPRIEALELTPPELTTVEAEDGTVLHAAIYKPEGEGPFPTIVSVYGGPHAQRVQNDWSLTADLRAQYLRGLGYLVIKLDNRGSARRGLAFEGALRHDMGNVELRDQVRGVEAMVARGLAIPDRVGIYGWSYGGYMAAMAVCRAPQTFKVAVAGAPVTSWDGYDTHYTERYMGTPQNNPDGYRRSSVMSHLEGLRGHLLLVHGLIDENVHFRHTARLIHALITARKPYELLLFPDERHMPRREEDRVYQEQRVVDYFRQHL